MRILVDTNILFSAILFPESKPAKALEHVVEIHTLILTDQNIAELREIVERKAPEHREITEQLLQALIYEEIHASRINTGQIRDVTDQPIVSAAIEENIDIILTGDKDFLNMNTKHPKYMTAAEFLERITHVK